jgi:hypothetical protein
MVRARLAALIGFVGVVHLDDVGAEHGELVCGERPGEHVGAIEDLDPFEWAHAVPPLERWAEGTLSLPR